MPKNVLNISIIGEWNTGTQELVIKSGGANGEMEFPYPSKVNINGSFGGSMYNISVGAGIKKIEVEAYETNGGTSFVYINAGGRCPVSTTYNYSPFDSLTCGDGTLHFDQCFFEMCYCSYASNLKYRPTKTWQDGWFTNKGWLGQYPDALCMNADYNGDCVIDNADADLFCAAKGYSTYVCGPQHDPIYC